MKLLFGLYGQICLSFQPQMIANEVDICKLHRQQQVCPQKNPNFVIYILSAVPGFPEKGTIENYSGLELNRTKKAGIE